MSVEWGAKIKNKRKFTSPSNVDRLCGEDETVVSGLSRLADAFVLLFGLMYVLHLDYNKKLIHMFTFCTENTKVL